MLGRSGFAKGIFGNYSNGPVVEIEKYIHGKEHDEQAMVEQAAV